MVRTDDTVDPQPDIPLGVSRGQGAAEIVEIEVQGGGACIGGIIDAIAAIKRIAAGTANQRVIASAAYENIAVIAAKQQIPPFTAGQRVGAVVAVEQVIA